MLNFQHVTFRLIKTKLSLLVGILLIISSTQSFSQCTDEHTTSNYIQYVASYEWGQSFTPKCTGILNTFGVISKWPHPILNVAIFKGEVSSGTLLGILGGQSITASTSNTDFKTFDFSSLAIPLDSDSIYTFAVVGSAVDFKLDTDNNYPGGSAFIGATKVSAWDLLFQFDILPTQLQPKVDSILRHTPLLDSTDLSQVVFQVKFDTTVSNVSVNDFNLNSSVGGSIDSVIAQSGKDYLVYVSNLSNTIGTVGIEINGVGGTSGTNDIAMVSYNDTLTISQLNDDDYLNQTKIGQTFTATTNTVLKKVTFYPSSGNHTFNGTADLKIYKGDESGGSAVLVSTQQIMLTTDVASTGQSFSLNTPPNLILGDIYSIVLDNFSGSGTYALNALQNSPYRGGHVIFTGYNPSYHFLFDLKIEIFEGMDMIGLALDSTSAVVHESYIHFITPLSTSISIDSLVSCIGLSNGGATASATGGTTPYTYSWSNAATTASITGVAAGTYSVTITDNIGWTSTSSSTITEPDLFSYSISVSDSITCNGGADGSITSISTSGSFSGYDIDLSPANFNPDPSFGNSISLSDDHVSLSIPLGFNFEFFDSTYSEIYISSNGFLTFEPSSGSGCCIGQLIPDPSTPNNLIAFAWGDLNPSNGGNIYHNISGTSPNRRFIMTFNAIPFFDNSSSSDVSSQVILYETSNVIEIHTTNKNAKNEQTMGIENFDGTEAIVYPGRSNSNWVATNDFISFTPVAQFSYAWSNGDSTSIISGLSAGTYTVTITNGDGCTAIDSVVVTEPSNLVSSIVLDSNDIGNGGGAAASATGGKTPYTFAWSNSASTASITGVAVGTYTVTITDMNGCTDSDLISITAGPVISMQLDSTVSCNGFSDGGATANVSAGTSPYTYAWSNSATTASITGVVVGTYSITVTDNTGLSTIDSVTITEPVSLMAYSVVDSNTTCNGFSDGGATATATGGTMPYTYSWSNSATTASITGVISGTYSVTITDMNGCTDSASTTITEPASLMAATVVDSNSSCIGFSDGGATASATGGTAPYTFTWSNSATTASITGVIAGTYSVTITDNNGCTDSASTTITEPTSLMAATAIDSIISCSGNSDGGATASATGGTAPYTYTWSNSATTASITGVTAGMYSVTVTDNNGCTNNTSINLLEPETLGGGTISQ